MFLFLAEVTQRAANAAVSIAAALLAGAFPFPALASELDIS